METMNETNIEVRIHWKEIRWERDEFYHLLGFLPGRIGHSYLIKPIQHKESGGMSRIMYGLYSMPFKYMAEFSDSERAKASAERREAQRKPTPQLTLQ